MSEDNLKTTPIDVVTIPGTAVAPGTMTWTGYGDHTITAVTTVAMNKRIAVEPIKPPEVKARKMGGMDLLDERVSLTALKVIYGDGQLLPGDIVYVNAGLALNHQWSKEVLRIGEVEFILMPIEFVSVATTSRPQYRTLGQIDGWAPSNSY